MYQGLLIFRCYYSWLWLFVLIVLFIYLQEFYTNDPKSFADYGRIINQRHFKRIMSLMEGSAVAIGGDSDESECYIGMY